jgi:hypothetical protein
MPAEFFPLNSVFAPQSRQDYDHITIISSAPGELGWAVMVRGNAEASGSLFSQAFIQQIASPARMELEPFCQRIQVTLNSYLREVLSGSTSIPEGLRSQEAQTLKVYRYSNQPNRIRFPERGNPIVQDR